MCRTAFGLNQIIYLYSPSITAVPASPLAKDIVAPVNDVLKCFMELNGCPFSVGIMFRLMNMYVDNANNKYFTDIYHIKALKTCLVAWIGYMLELK